MKFPRMLAAIIASNAISTANGAPMDDMENLRTACENAANALDASSNDTAPMNTSTIIQNIMWQLGASKANLALLNTTATQTHPQIDNSTMVNSTVTKSTTTTTNSLPTNAPASLDSPYFDYIDSIATLAIATARRGSQFHAEPNLPVYNALHGLTTGVEAYGLVLRDAGLISSRAQVRTFMAESTLVDAQRIWADAVVYPY